MLDSCRQLQQDGADVTYLPVESNGLVNLTLLEDTIKAKLDAKVSTLLVSAMLVNNEIGVIQPIKQIAEICHKYGAFMHTDAAQAVGKVQCTFL